MTTRIKGIPITLGDRQLILPPASLATLEDLAARLDGLNARLSGAGSLSMADFSVAADLVLACLQRNYPDIARTFVTQNIGLENVEEMLTMCYDTSGLLRKAHEAQAAKQAAAQGGGTLGESTGTASLPTS